MDIPIAPEMDPRRRDQIEEAARKLERMRMARFYFKSSEFYRDNLPDKRSYRDYFKILEDDSKSKDKVKIRQTINMIVRDTKSIAGQLCLNNDEEKKLFLSFLNTFRAKFIGSTIPEVLTTITNSIVDESRMDDFFLEVVSGLLSDFAGTIFKSLTRWPRIYVDDSQYIENNALINDSLTCELIPEKYLEDEKSSEIDYNENRTAAFSEDLKFTGRPKNKFSYKTGQVELDFVKNLTPGIERAIMEKLKNLFRSKNSDGFSAHHIIPRKKLEVFFNLQQMNFTKFPNIIADFDLKSAAYILRHNEYPRIVQLCYQFQEKGLNTPIQPFSTQTSDAILSASGNLFYGPCRRSDDDSSGYSVDKAGAIVLSEDEYKSLVHLDDALNEYFESYGFRIKNVCESATDTIVDKLLAKIQSDGLSADYHQFIQQSCKLMAKIHSTFCSIKENHGLKISPDPIPFDPRLVDRDAADESKWFYRRRQIAKRSLPNWLLTLLQEVSQELKVDLDIDLNLDPVMSRDQNNRGFSTRQPMLRLKPRLAPNFIADYGTIYESTDAIFMRHLIEPED